MYYNILILIHHAYESARNNCSSTVTHIILYNKIETTSKMIFKNVSVQNKYN